MKKRFLTCVLTVSALSMQAQANNFSLGLNDNVLSTDFQVDLNKEVNASAGYIYSEKGGHLLSGAIHTSHDTGIHHFEIGAQFSQLWAERSDNGSVVGVGGRYPVELGSDLSIQTSGYYSPSVLSFGDIDGSIQVDGKLQYQLNPGMALFVGYRHISFKYDDAKDSTFDSGFYLGARMSF